MTLPRPARYAEGKIEIIREAIIMYTLFANEKLGMPVENVRLEAIRQEIEARRLAGEVQSRQFGIKSLIRRVSSVLAARKGDLPVVVSQPTTAFER